SSTRPHASPACSRRANVVVHFPARPKPVALICQPDRIHHFTAHRVTKIRKTVKRFECSVCPPIPKLRVASCSRYFAGSSVGSWKHRLFVPGEISGRPSQSVSRVGLKRSKKIVQPARTNLSSAFKQHVHVRLGGADQPVETCRNAERLGCSQLRQASECGQERHDRRFRTIGQKDALNAGGRVCTQACQIC